MSNNTIAAGDICPIGWGLPYGGSSADPYGGNTSGGFKYLASQLGVTSFYDVNSSIILRSYPNNFIYSGYYTGSSANNRGSSGLYWSSTHESREDSYFMSVSEFNFYWDLSSRAMYNALAIRCRLGSSEEFTVTYNGNGAGDTINNIPVSQTAIGNGMVDMITSSTIPTRDGNVYSFAGWQDKYGQIVQPGDTYHATDTNAVLYAIWTVATCNPAATTIGTGNTSTDAVCLQDMNSTVKSTMTIADSSTGTYTLRDARDNKTYTIAKLADGNVWMTQNLNFAPSADMFIGSADSDVTSFMVPASTTSFETTNDDTTYISPKVLADSTYGAYYSYAAAIASTAAYSGNDQNISTSVCPKGWDLPTKYQYDYLRSIANFSTFASAQASPYNFIRAGYKNGASIYDQSSSTHLWTSTNYSTAYSYRSTVISNSYGSNYKTYGYSIRCLASNGTGTVHYYANGGTGTMADQTNVDVNASIIRPNDFVPADDHKQFRTWNTAADGSGTNVVANTPLEIVVTNGGTVNLYAQWDDLYKLTFTNTITSSVQTKIVIVGQSTTVNSPSTWSRSGYRLVGWDTSSIGETAVYTNGQSITPSSDLSLYTVWKPTYTIEYNGNGSTDGSAVTHTDVIEGDAVNLYASNYARTGYGFAGWSTNPSAQPGDGVSTIYGPNETIAAPARPASGTLTLYAVWVQSAGNLQNWAGCSSMSAGAVTALTDTRDNNTYAIAKLADGNCWMIENLRLDPAGKTLNNTNTNNPASDFSTTVAGLSSSSFAACSTSSGSTCTDQYSAGMGNITSSASSPSAYSQNSRWYSYGGMYNWYTATAGNGVYSIYDGVTAGDLCPAGWGLPYGGSSTNLYGGNTNGGFYYLLVRLGSGTAISGISGSSIVRSYPNNYVYSGTYQSNSAYSRGSNGHYWASWAPNSAVYGASIYVTSGSIIGDIATARATGLAIRCRAGEYFTISYDANAGTDTVTDLPSSQTRLLTPGNTVFAIPSTAPTRSGYTFNGWNTAADGSGTSYAAGSIYTASQTTSILYAQWS